MIFCYFWRKIVFARNRLFGEADLIWKVLQTFGLEEFGIWNLEGFGEEFGIWNLEGFGEEFGIWMDLVGRI